MRIIFLSFLVSSLSAFHESNTHPSSVLPADSLDLPNELAVKVIADFELELNVSYNFIELDRLPLTNDTEKMEERKLVYPSGSILSLNMSEFHAGLQSVFVKIDDARESIYTVPIRLTMKGNHSIVFRLVDQWGNESFSSPIHLKVI
ncbi:MAG: hypothetical protein KDC99_11055 [Cyclobacteriaceae bacterium]|nr:hypothetical protein [Cyclobacteriaceae bacterium]